MASKLHTHPVEPDKETQMLNDKSAQTVTDDNDPILIELKTTYEKLVAKHKNALARGTSDVTEQAAKVTKAVTLADKIEALLRTQTASEAELVKALDVTPKALAEAMKGLPVYNVGTATEARWSWIIGDDTGNDVLYPLVERLLMERPMTTHELVAATGARYGRCSGAIVALEAQPARVRVWNLGHKNKGRWLVIPTSIKPSRLKSKQ